jgi:NAD(P)-dependent dehydrogenase (short-subunit alcohol dehydrogenase family)
MSLIVAGVAVTAAVGAIYYSVSGYAKPYEPERNSLLGRTVVVTGATTGLGLESAKRLAAGGANVIVTARTESKGQSAVEEVKKYLSELIKVDNTNQQQTITYKVLDFSSLNSIKTNLQNDWNDVTKIDVLLNNAGAVFQGRIITVDGLESTIQTNHLGYFIVTALLFPKLAKDARIVNVSSAAHGFVNKKGLNFDNLWKADKKKDEEFGTLYTYSESKFANILFTEELQRRINAASLSMFTMSLHPGAVTTELGRSVNGTLLGTLIISVFRFFATIGIAKTVSNGSATQVWLSATPSITDEMKGKYFVDCKETKVSIPTPESDAVRLWEESEQMGNIKFTVA